MRLRNLSFIFLGLLALSCNKEDANEQIALNSPEEYLVIRPSVVDTLIPQDYIAKIAATEKVDIRAKIKGFVEKIHIDEGQYVRKGQSLFTINNDLFRQSLLESQAKLNSAVTEQKAAELELSNIRKLFEKNIVSDAELKSAQNKVELMQSKVEQEKVNVSTAKIHLSYSEIKAPFNGFVNLIPNKVGSLLNEGDLLTTLSKTDQVYAYFDMSEKDYLNLVMQKETDLELKNSVEFVTATGQMHKFSGKIETSVAEIDQESGNIAYRARFPNPEFVLKHGSTGRVRIKKQLNNALLIPQKATFEIQDKVYVFTVDEKNVLHSQQIEIGRRLNNYYVVETGLDASSKILLEGIQEVKEGMQIIPKENISKNQLAKN